MANVTKWCARIRLRAVWFLSLQSPLGRKLSWQKNTIGCYQIHLILWEVSQFKLSLNPFKRHKAKCGDLAFTNRDNTVLSCYVGENHKRVSSIETGQSSRRTLAIDEWDTDWGLGRGNKVILVGFLGTGSCVLGIQRWTQAKPSGWEFPLQYFFTLRHQKANCQCLSFPICKMELRKLPTYESGEHQLWSSYKSVQHVFWHIINTGYILTTVNVTFIMIKIIKILLSA